jgi:hypothetical protein
MISMVELVAGGAALTAVTLPVLAEDCFHKAFCKGKLIDGAIAFQ